MSAGKACDAAAPLGAIGKTSQICHKGLPAEQTNTAMLLAVLCLHQELLTLLQDVQARHVVLHRLLNG